VEGDVSDEKVVEHVVDVVAESLGSLDVMMANAGIPQLGLLRDTTSDQWDRVMSVNAKGVFLCFKYAAKKMVEQGRGGRLIATSSSLGQKAAFGRLRDFCTLTTSQGQSTQQEGTVMEKRGARSARSATKFAKVSVALHDVVVRIVEHLGIMWRDAMRNPKM